MSFTSFWVALPTFSAALVALWTDALIVEVASRLESALRNYESLARLGGDEFATILQRVTREDVREVCERMEENLRQPFSFEGQEIELSAAIGIAMFPEDADGLKKLITAADQAMYLSKAEGQGFVFSKVV